MKSAVNLIALDSKERILLLKRHAADPIEPHKWCLPGGSVEDGETLEEALCREIREETGCSLVTFYKVIERIYEKKLLTHYYRGSIRGVVVINGESSAFGWFDLQTLKGMDLAFGQKEIIFAALQKGEPIG